jgi:hypothetical protein
MMTARFKPRNETDPRLSCRRALSSAADPKGLPRELWICRIQRPKPGA